MGRVGPIGVLLSRLAQASCRLAVAHIEEHLGVLGEQPSTSATSLTGRSWPCVEKAFTRSEARALIISVSGFAKTAIVECRTALDVPTRDLERHCRLGEGALTLLEQAVQKLGLSMRAYVRVMRVARTIADLAGEGSIGAARLAEAIGYRELDRAHAPIGS